jgi:hypothetical protein
MADGGKLELWSGQTENCKAQGAGGKTAGNGQIRSDAVRRRHGDAETKDSEVIGDGRWIMGNNQYIYNP